MVTLKQTGLEIKISWQDWIGEMDYKRWTGWTIGKGRDLHWLLELELLFSAYKRRKFVVAKCVLPVL